MFVRRSTRSVVAVGALACIVAGLAGVAAAQREPAPAPAASRPQDPGQPRRPMADLFGRMVGDLKATEGCLGVDSGQMMSGKRTIFAWFENKAAAMRWYRSETHKELMKPFAAEDSESHDHAPMDDVPDDVPIMAIASITMADAPKFPGVSLPVSQIAIELYTPLSGGLFLGGRFAPEGLTVGHMHDYTPKVKGEAAPLE